MLSDAVEALCGEAANPEPQTPGTSFQTLTGAVAGSRWGAMTIWVGPGDDEAAGAARTIGHLPAACLAHPTAGRVAAQALDAVSTGALGPVAAGRAVELGFAVAARVALAAVLARCTCGGLLETAHPGLTGSVAAGAVQAWTICRLTTWFRAASGTPVYGGDRWADGLITGHQQRGQHPHPPRQQVMHLALLSFPTGAMQGPFRCERPRFIVFARRFHDIAVTPKAQLSAFYRGIVAWLAAARRLPAPMAQPGTART